MDRKLPIGITLVKSTNRESIRISFTYKGVPCRETLKLTPSSQNIKYAERLRGQILMEIERGAFDYATHFPKSKRLALFGAAVNTNLTVGQALQKYLDRLQAHGRLSSYETAARLTKYFDHLAVLPVSELTSQQINDWIKSQGVTVKTVKNRLIVLRGAVKIAMEEGALRADPFALVTLSNISSKNNRKRKTEPINPFSLPEAKKVINAPSSVRLQANLQLAFFTGCRPGELIGLRWKDVDLDGGWLHITASVVVGVFEEQTKTKGSKRAVKLLPLAKQALERLQEINRLADVEPEFVLLNQYLKRYSCDRGWYSSWGHAVKLAKVKYRNPYQARHTFASLLLMQGEPITWVADQLGHDSTEMVMRTYGKWISSASQSYVPRAALYTTEEI